MKVLAKLGSTKTGNTGEIVWYFEKKLRELGEIEFDRLYPEDVDLDFCTGCHNCIIYGEDSCPHHKTVREIEQRLLVPDRIVLVTPG